jgi:hypothetical protein
MQRAKTAGLQEESYEILTASATEISAFLR